MTKQARKQRSIALADLSPAALAHLTHRELPLPEINGTGPNGEPRVLEFCEIRGVELKVNRKARTVEGWAAVFQNVDDGGDRLLTGSSDRTVEEDGPEGEKRIKFFWQHREGLGMPTLLQPEPQGLFTRSKVTDHRDLDLKLALIADGVADSMSIGWSPREWKFVEEEGHDFPIREVSDFELFEISVVYWGMNRLARVTALKHAGDIAASGGPLAEALKMIFAGSTALQSPDVTAAVAKASRDVLIEIGQCATETLAHLGYVPEAAKNLFVPSGGQPAPADPDGGDPGDGEDVIKTLDALLSTVQSQRDETAIIRREYQ